MLGVVTIAHGIEPARLAAVMRTWDVPGIASVTIVHSREQEVAFKPSCIPLVRSVVPAPSVPFSRATWRNIGLRFCPESLVLFIDADCALVEPKALGVVFTETAFRKLVVLPPAWSTEQHAEAFLLAPTVEASRAVLSGVAARRPDATHAGTCALDREIAIEVSWDDYCTAGWGYEDDDFCRRALLHLKQDAPVNVAGLVHVWHPARGRSRGSKLQNKVKALARRNSDIVSWYARAENEIAMQRLPSGALAGIEDAAKAQGVALSELQVRQMFTGLNVLAQSHSVSTYLRYGQIPPECAYAPVIGATVTDFS